MLKYKFNSNQIRKNILDMSFSGQTVHIGCAFSIVEIVKVIYENYILSNSCEYNENKNFCVLSKGHGVMAFYGLFKMLNWITDDQFKNYYKDNTLLKGLSDSHVKGLEVTSGSLGHGLSIAVGMAHAEKLKKSNKKIYCIVGDGESNEGPIWEALLYAAHWGLDNLIVIFDCNQFQAMGRIDDVMKLEPFNTKLNSFNFETIEVNGHSENELLKALDQFEKSILHKPKALIARTIKGKGVTFMENDNIWHYTRLTSETYNSAVKELGI